MTLEELQVEAKRLGYRLVPVSNYIRLSPCKTCGRKRSFQEWWDGKNQVWFYKCPVCNSEAPGAPTHTGARKNWNETCGKSDD